IALGDNSIWHVPVDLIFGVRGTNRTVLAAHASGQSITASGSQPVHGDCARSSGRSGRVGSDSVTTRQPGGALMAKNPENSVAPRGIISGAGWAPSGRVRCTH